MILEQIKKLISEHIGKDVSEINDDSNIIEDLGADSLDIVQMLITMESEFNITFDEDEVGELRTVKDIAKFVEKKAKHK